jgi:hypothetical protein
LFCTASTVKGTGANWHDVVGEMQPEMVPSPTTRSGKLGFTAEMLGASARTVSIEARPNKNPPHRRLVTWTTLLSRRRRASARLALRNLMPPPAARTSALRRVLRMRQCGKEFKRSGSAIDP